MTTQTQTLGETKTEGGVTETPRIKGLEFAQQIQPEITKILYDKGIGLKESKQIGKALSLFCQAFSEVLNKKEVATESLQYKWDYPRHKEVTA